MKQAMKFLIPALAMLIVAPGGAVADPTKALIESGEKCRAITDRVQRLLCFDELFATPVDLTRQSGLSGEIPQVEVGPIRQSALQLESSRLAGETGWVVAMRRVNSDMMIPEKDFDASLGDKGTISPGGIDVFMTMQESPSFRTQSEKGEAILLLSCEANITTLGVILPKPIKSLQAALSLSSDRGVLLRLNWRDGEYGNVFIAGRGLESIDTIKTISNFDRLHLGVSYPDGPKTYVFDVADLKQRLKPLRAACGW